MTLITIDMEDLCIAAEGDTSEDKYGIFNAQPAIYTLERINEWKELGYKVKDTDKITFQGKVLKRQKLTYILLNKPKGFATTTSEGKGRTVMDLVANATDAKIRPIGRLGRNSLGLIAQN